MRLNQPGTNGWCKQHSDALEIDFCVVCMVDARVKVTSNVRMTKKENKRHQKKRTIFFLFIPLYILFVYVDFLRLVCTALYCMPSMVGILCGFSSHKRI